MAATPPQSLWQKLLEALMLFLPKQFEEARKRGLLWVVAIAFFTLFIVPPLVVLLAAFSLKMLEKPGYDITNALRDSYVSFIYSAFDIERRAGSVERIDYYQAIDFVTPPKEPTHLSINLAARQKALISFSTIKLVPKALKCSLPTDQRAQELLRLRLNGIELKMFYENEDPIDVKEAKIDAGFWKKHQGAFDPEQRSFVLEFYPTDFVQKQCAHLAVKGSVTVFKDVYAVNEPEAK